MKPVANHLYSHNFIADVFDTPLAFVNVILYVSSSRRSQITEV